jgi:hypothetical protein
MSMHLVSRIGREIPILGRNSYLTINLCGGYTAIWYVGTLFESRLFAFLINMRVLRPKTTHGGIG